jgi:2-keto-4-pentenoate hydratase/2-oxohepta-3-ene-1,7-dioic acid hydratase in catechol pathway
MSRKLTPVKISELKVGDHVLTYGRVFELTERNVSKSHPPSEDGSQTLWFRTKLIETLSDVIPEHWVADWIIQSNDLPRWSRVDGESNQGGTEYVDC